MRQFIDEKEQESYAENQALRFPDKPLYSLDDIMDPVEERSSVGKGKRLGRYSPRLSGELFRQVIPLPMNPGILDARALCSRLAFAVSG